jgi:hypothetical protein
VISPAGMLSKVNVGTAAGWLMSFHLEAAGVVVPVPILELGQDDYHADIRAALPAGLEGGSYSFVIEGMTDEHYMIVKSAKTLRLFLFWLDANASFTGYMANVAGVTGLGKGLRSALMPEDARVAELAIVSTKRKAGARLYETTIEARERVFDRASTRRLPRATTKFLDPSVMALTLANEHVISAVSYPLLVPPSPTAREFPAIEQAETVLSALTRLKGLMESLTNKRGRGMHLIRWGKLHIGPRLMPLEGEIKELLVGNGLLEVESTGPVVADPNFFDEFNPAAEAPKREQFKLTLKGRPDIKPGDVVAFGSPPGEIKTRPGVVGGLFAAAPGLSLATLGNELADRIDLYVSSVEHRLGRTAGFVTTVTGVQIDLADPWDHHTPSRREQIEQGENSGSGTPEGRAGDAVQRRILTALDQRKLTEAGEVRGMNSMAGLAPSQTLTVWRGLAPADGRPNGAGRLAVERPSPAPVEQAPYLTPFAWGKCGLVLPRYPGTRVLVTHRNGEAQDPVEIGALWEAGKGPDSQPGDWWLILPLGVSPSSRAAIPDLAIPIEHAGQATNDLIDAEGNRIIEVAGFTIRVGAGSLGMAGDRPAPATDPASATIEHADGQSKIVMKPDGSVTITATRIEFDAGVGDITLKANNVNVQVLNRMDVS